MELKLNMYVRTKAGKIAKIINKYDNFGGLHGENFVWVLDDCSILALHSRKVIKASYNIIDLIEAGDYVNGNRVYVIDKEYGVLGENDVFYKEENIKSIVTKEMFSNAEYRVE